MINFNRKKKPNSKFGNILITSSSKKIPLIDNVIKSKNLIDKNIKIFAGDNNHNVISKFFVDKFWKMPKTIDANYTQILKKLFDQNIKIIIPTRDGELNFWSKYKKKLNKKGIIVLVNDIKKINICNDKVKFNKFCIVNKILTPQIYNPNFKENQKLIIKERFDSTSLITKNISSKNYKKYLVNYRNPFIQKYIPGKEISVDIWSDKKNIKNYFISRYRELVIDGESHITKGFENKVLNRIIDKVIYKLKLHGPYMLQFIQSKDKFYLIECNPRVGGASTYSMNNGLDIILWSLIEAYKIDKKFLIKYKKKKTFNRLVRAPFDNFR